MPSVSYEHGKRREKSSARSEVPGSILGSVVFFIQVVLETVIKGKAARFGRKMR